MERAFYHWVFDTGRAVKGIYKLIIPNREVQEVFVLQIQEWFRERVVDDEESMHEFCQAFLERKPDDIQKQLNVILNRMISILSNAESGDGFSDILVEPEEPDAGSMRLS